MQLIPVEFSMLAHYLKLERKRQGLSRAQAAAVCGVSTSFIRDAESDPVSCSLGRFLMYMEGLGLRIEVTGWSQAAQTEILNSLPVRTGNTPADESDDAESAE
jgi:transcriptional regulator with XRE-family HTH domain